MSRGDVLGVFQVEGAGMRRMLMEMQPGKFEHIIAGISLFRPGPMEYIPTYIRRLHGDEPMEYKHPKLEPILAETYGIIVYQEQIIQIAVQLAGYLPGEADEIRKAVGKKIKEKIEAHKAKFIAGCGEERHRSSGGRSDLWRHRVLRALRFQQSARRRLCGDDVPDGVSQSALSRRIHDGADDGGAERREDGPADHRNAAAWASTCCRPP